MRDKICASLRRARTDAGLTQAQAAEAAGISEDAYQKIESRKNGLSMEYMRPLCAAFGVPLLSLLALCFDGIFPEPADAEYEAQVPVRVCDRERQEAALLCLMAEAAGRDAQDAEVIRLAGHLAGMRRTSLVKGRGKRV